MSNARLRQIDSCLLPVCAAWQYDGASRLEKCAWIGCNVVHLLQRGVAWYRDFCRERVGAKSGGRVRTLETHAWYTQHQCVSWASVGFPKLLYTLLQPYVGQVEPRDESLCRAENVLKVTDSVRFCALPVATTVLQRNQFEVGPTGSGSTREKWILCNPGWDYRFSSSGAPAAAAATVAYIRADLLLACECVRALVLVSRWVWVSVGASRTLINSNSCTAATSCQVCAIHW